MSVFYLVAGAMVVGSLLFAFGRWYDSERQRVLRALRHVASRQVAEVRDGEIAKIVGRLEHDRQSLIAPLSGRRCVLYRVVVEEREGENGRWTAVIERTRFVPFLLRDDTGHARICPAAPDVAIVQDRHYESGTFLDATPALEAFLAEHGRRSTGLLGFNKAMRYLEGVLEEGELVAVVGQGRWEADPDAETTAGAATGYRERAFARRLVIEPPPGGRVLLSDDAEATPDER